jgi:hypothetical protein
MPFLFWQSFQILYGPLFQRSYLINYLAGGLGLIGGVLNFLEEIMPLTDIIPSFTIAWFIRKNAIEKSFAKIQ